MSFIPLKFDDEKNPFQMKEPSKNSNKKEKTADTESINKKESYEKNNNGDITLDFTSLINNGASIEYEEPVVEKKKTTRRKKKTVEVDMSSNNEDGKSDRKLNEFESNAPYMDKYQETNAILRNSIYQLDMGLEQLQGDADYIRKSNSRKKYDYLSLIHDNIGKFIGNKITAARELNNTITKCNDFEFKRYKELKMIDDKDDDKAIMDAYQAFVSMPVGNGFNNPLGPGSVDVTLNNRNINGVDIVNKGMDGYQNYINNMTPEQHMMSLENNQNIKQVIVYEQKTGRRWFDVIDLRTGQSIPNTDKMDMMLIDEFELDIVNRVARSINMNMTLPLYIIDDPIMNEY